MSAHSDILPRMSLRGGEHGKSFLNLFFEVALITIGVFLALWRNNWHEDHEHRAQGQAGLRISLEKWKREERSRILGSLKPPSFQQRPRQSLSGEHTANATPNAFASTWRLRAL